MNNRSSRGFTLAELLIVVAIIAVLTAIAIPVFSGQVERGREATDTANIRDQYAEVMTKANETGGDVNTDGGEFAKIPLVQKKDDWQNDADGDSLSDIATIQGGGPVPGGSAWVSYSRTLGAVIHFSGATDAMPPAGDAGGAGGGTQSDTQGQTQGQAQGGSQGGTQGDTQGPKSEKATAEEIAALVGKLMHDAKNYAENPLTDNGAHVSVTLYPNGTYTVSSKKCGNAEAALEDNVRNAMANYVAANVDHATNFVVTVTINNGNDGTGYSFSTQKIKDKDKGNN